MNACFFSVEKLQDLFGIYFGNDLISIFPATKRSKTNSLLPCDGNVIVTTFLRNNLLVIRIQISVTSLSSYRVILLVQQQLAHENWLQKKRRSEKENTQNIASSLPRFLQQVFSLFIKVKGRCLDSDREDDLFFLYLVLITLT